MDNDRKSIRLGLLLGIHVRLNSPVIEREFGSLEPEVRCAHKLREMWGGKRYLVKELELKFLEAGGGDPMNKCLRERVKIGKDVGCRDWQGDRLPFHVMGGIRV